MNDNDKNSYGPGGPGNETDNARADAAGAPGDGDTGDRDADSRDVGEGATGDPFAETLAADHAATEAEMTRLREELLRALAEMDNLRKRSEREREDTAKFAISRFAQDLLSVADNLQRALDAVPAPSADTDPALATLVEGVALTERELLAVLGRHGIEKIEPLGEKFDHDRHQAMMEVPDPSVPVNTVVQVLQPGYLLKGRLLRPAMVGVAKGGPAADKSPEGAALETPKGPGEDGIDTTA